MRCLLHKSCVLGSLCMTQGIDHMHATLEIVHIEKKDTLINPIFFSGSTVCATLTHFTSIHFRRSQFSLCCRCTPVWCCAYTRTHFPFLVSLPLLNKCVTVANLQSYAAFNYDLLLWFFTVYPRNCGIIDICLHTHNMQANKQNAPCTCFDVNGPFEMPIH